MAEKKKPDAQATADATDKPDAQAEAEAEAQQPQDDGPRTVLYLQGASWLHVPTDTRFHPREMAHPHVKGARVWCGVAEVSDPDALAFFASRPDQFAIADALPAERYQPNRPQGLTAEEAYAEADARGKPVANQEDSERTRRRTR